MSLNSLVVATATKTRITPEQFVAAWQRASTALEAAKALSADAGRPVAVADVAAIARKLRREGVLLKPMSPVSAPLPVVEPLTLAEVRRLNRTIDVLNLDA
jgi:hypothetical protein